MALTCSKYIISLLASWMRATLFSGCPFRKTGFHSTSKPTTQGSRVARSSSALSQSVTYSKVIGGWNVRHEYGIVGSGRFGSCAGAGFSSSRVSESKTTSPPSEVEGDVDVDGSVILRRTVAVEVWWNTSKSGNWFPVIRISHHVSCSERVRHLISDSVKYLPLCPNNRESITQ